MFHPSAVAPKKCDLEKLEENKRRNKQIEPLCRLRDGLKDLDDLEVLEEFEVEATKAKAEESRKEQEEETPKFWNCGDGEFSPHHQCYSEL